MPPDTPAPSAGPATRSLSTRWRGRRRRKRTLLWRFRRFLFLLLLLVVGGISGAGLVLSQVDLPDATEPLAETSFICTAEVAEDCNANNATAQLNGEENRVLVDYEQIPDVMIQAVVAAEDRDFFTHSGIDPVGIIRAAWADINDQEIRQGGSTITQQYVKNTYLTNERSFTRKIREAILAVKLENELSKPEILEGYLNTVYFGRGAYGVQAASRAYFGRDVEELTLGDAAYLAGLLRAPEQADAERFPEEAYGRRRSVLDAMLDEGYINAEQHEAVDNTQWNINPFGLGNLLPRTEVDTLGNVRGAQYGTEYVMEYVRQELVEMFNGDEAFVYGGGLRVYTTMRHDMQEAAYRTVVETLNEQGDPEASIVAVGPEGRIMAMMGGRDFNVSQVNLAVGADGGGSGRQPGSAFKPFALAEALAQGFSAEASLPAPGSVSLDIGLGEPWQVSGGGRGGGHTLLSGTQASSNVFYAQLMLRLGTANVIDMANRLGVTSDLPEVPSIVLGAGEVSVLDMASAFSTFRDHGQHFEPVMIERVEDSDGNVLFQADHQPEPVISPQIADTVTTALRGVVTGGTGTASAIDDPSYGKTGTAQNNKDAWFVGYTCDVSTAVWMGHVGAPGQDVPAMTNVHGRTVQGGTFPAEMWRDFMERIAPLRRHDCPEVEVVDFPGQEFGDHDSLVSSSSSNNDTSPATAAPTAPPSSAAPPPSVPPTQPPPTPPTVLPPPTVPDGDGDSEGGPDP